MRWGDTHDQLHDLLGADALQKLVKVFGGRHIHVPTSVRETRTQRTRRILTDLSGGATYQEAADAAGVHISTAVRHAKRG